MTATPAVPRGDVVLAAVVDRTHARFFEVTADGTTELTSLRSPAMRGGRFHSDRHGGPGWGEHDYHDRVREERRRHHHAIATELERLHRAIPEAWLVLAGPSAAALRRALPPELDQRVIGTEKLTLRDATPVTVRTVAVRCHARHQREADRQLIAAMREGLGTGRGENGLRAVLRALAKGQVAVLLVPPGDASADIAAAIDAARREDASVRVIRDPEAAAAIDGIAALLRFSETAAPAGYGTTASSIERASANP